MRNLYVTFLILFGTFEVASAKPSKYSLLEATYVAIEYHEIQGYREGYLPEYSSNNREPRNEEQEEFWRIGSNFLVNLDIIRIYDWNLYWNNNVHMDATTNQVRRVGWEWELGVTVIPNKLQVFSYHHSEHVLEEYFPDKERYPVKDTYGVRFILLDKSKEK